MKTWSHCFSLNFRYFTFVFLLLGMAHQASADGGYYIGGSVGSAGIEISEIDFDESDSAMKVYGGYNFDVAVLDLAIEGGYVDFGSPSGNINFADIDTDVSISLNAWNAFGLAGIELGPIGVFAKAGIFKWDVDGGSSGSDPVYGVGARFSLGSLELRGEYEIYDIDSAGDGALDLTMLSVGVVWTF